MSAIHTTARGPDPRVHRLHVSSMVTGFALGLAVATFAWVQVIPDERATADPSGLSDFVLVDGDPSSGTDESDQGATGPETRVVRRGAEGVEAVGTGAGSSAVGGGLATDGERAAGGGGGAAGSSPGVTASEIVLGATYVGEGIAEAFLGEVKIAMEAVRTRVNREGGVHGRQLKIEYQEDQWNPQTGLTKIQNLVKQGVFAFAVSPSSEGLNAASNTGVFSENRVPVVGADGLNNTQFTDPWIWPVATATTTNVHIIMRDAWQRAGCGEVRSDGRAENPACDKLHPAIVFGNTYRFGVEGAYAFNQAYHRLTNGRDIPGFGPKVTGCTKGSRYCGIKDGVGQYGPQNDIVRDACRATDDHPACNFLLLLVEPGTAQDWMFGFEAASSFEVGGCCGMAGAQPLFTTSFGENCGAKCDGMVVWTGYNPPIGEFASRPEVTRYTRELESQSSSADRNNQFTMGGYVGMELLIAALDRAGPDLTRERLVEVLNGMDPPLTTGLTVTAGLSWSAESRYANHSAHGYVMRWAGSKFGGFEKRTAAIRDPWLGLDNQSPT